jgi:hypothetical protein
MVLSGECFLGLATTFTGVLLKTLSAYAINAYWLAMFISYTM